MGKKNDGKKGGGAGKEPAAAAAPAPAPAALPSFDTALDAMFTKAKKGHHDASPVVQGTVAPSTKTIKRKRSEEAIRPAAPVADDEDDDDDDDDDDYDSDASLDLSEIEKEMEEQGLKRGEDEEDEESFEDGNGEGDGDGDGDEEGEGQDSDSDSEAASDPSDDENAPPPVHESLSTTKPSTALHPRRQREEESKEVRDKRSIFVGNVPVSALQSKSLTRALKKRIVAMSPYPSITRVDALRYRSVAFSVPTGDYSAEDSAAAEKKRARSQAYKQAVAEADAAENGEPAARGQVYLNPRQKRKVAYINQDINERSKSVNAFITLDKLTDDDYEKLAKIQGSSLEQARKITPSVLAALIAARLDDTLFEGRHLRLDLAVPLPLSELVAAGLDKFLSAPSTSAATADGFTVALSRVLGGSGGKSRQENSRTLFVGNMDFEADEEDVRALFEGLVREERGPASAQVSVSGDAAITAVLDRLGLPAMQRGSDDGEDEDTDLAATPTWVTSVRLIRDPATQMGKGFGYIRFRDEESVDEMMAIYEADEAFLNAVKPGKGGSSTRGGLNEDGSRRDFKRRIKLNKRALRLARCKASSGSGGKGGGNKAKGGRGAAGSATATASSSSSTRGTPQTPPRNKDHRRRSMGAPTPGGTSPGGTRPSKTGSANAASASTSSSGAIANPPPKRQRTTEDMARLALKRNDPDRQAKRMAKKEKKRSELKAGGAAGGGDKRERVKLDAKKAHRRGEAGGRARPAGGEGKAAGGGGKPSKRA